MGGEADKVISEIKKWGNSAAIRLPRKILAAAGFEPGSQVSIKTETDRIIIERALGIDRDKDVAILKGIVPPPRKPVSIEDIKESIKAKGAGQ